MTNGLFFYEKNYKMNEGCEVYVFLSIFLSIGLIFSAICNDIVSLWLFLVKAPFQGLIFSYICTIKN